MLSLSEADQQKVELRMTDHEGADQRDTRSSVTEKDMHARQENLEALMGLIEETIGVHLQIQVLVEELHDRSELSRACRGILRDLYRLGAQTVPQLARSRPVSRQNVQMLVKRLVAEEMAEFIRNPEHKRSHLVRLTSHGKAVLEEMWNREREALGNLDLQLPIDDLRHAANVLTRLREGLEYHQINQEVSKG